MTLEIETFAKYNSDDAPKPFKVGDMVLRYDGSLDNTHSTDRKLKIKWDGPFVVSSIGRNSATLKTVDDMPLKGKCAMTRLKKYHGFDSR
jgi:hypothetical protein